MSLVPYVVEQTNRGERNVYMRCFLVPVQVSRHDVLLSERVGEVFQIVGATFFITLYISFLLQFILDFFHS